MPDRPLLLDLFCCEGGAGMGYHRAGFNVVGVDLKDQPRYPFEFVRADARSFVLRYLEAGERWQGRRFDAIHASPPCQSYVKGLGAVNRAQGRDYAHDDLIAPMRDLLVQTRAPWVIENVQNAPLENPVRLCGSSFGLPIRRHRLFESNVPLMALPCDHSWQTEKKYWTGWSPKGKRTRATVVQIYGNAGEKHEWPAALGVDWMTYEGMAEAIPPAYTEQIGGYLMAAVRQEAAA